jgi:hypothetical protein
MREGRKRLAKAHGRGDHGSRWLLLLLLEGMHMRRSNLELRAAGLLGLLVGCGGSTPMSLKVGGEGGPCTAGGGCDPGLLCTSHLCVRSLDSAIPATEGGAGGSGTGGQAGVGGYGGLSGNGGSASGGAGGHAGTGGQTGTGGYRGLGGNGGYASGGAGGSAPVSLCVGKPMDCGSYWPQSACEAVGCYSESLYPSMPCVGSILPCSNFTSASLCDSVGCTWQSGSTPDASLGGASGTGGTRGNGGATSSGGIGGLDGPIPTGGVFSTGGTKASGGTMSTGGSSGGGAGGSCTNVVPCGGDVVGTWTVTSSCLKVTGQLDMSMLGLGCVSAPVTGALHVSGTWTANSNGTYSDNTTTSGNEQITLPASCLNVSGVTVACDRIASVLVVLGYASVACIGVASGGCTCSASITQTGGAGLVSIDAQTSGAYTALGNVVTTDGSAQYSYCVSGNRMTWTPQSASPTTTGMIVF